MKRKTQRVIHHSVDSLVLVCILSLGFLGIVYFQHQVTNQIIVVLLLCLLYILWGATHHYHEGNLTGKVVLEYVLMAILAALILVLFLTKA